ncbi:MAG: Eco57I restriction-modification methylase domain-containing protein [Promethearchaeota archaeon]
MVLIKPREIRNYLLSQNLPFGLIAKISILRFLEVIHAIEPSTLLDLFEKSKSSTSSTLFFKNFLFDIDSFLENYCMIPYYLVKGVEISEDENLSGVTPNQMEIFLHRIYTTEFIEYFQNLDDDFLGKLNESQAGNKKGVVYTPKTIIEHMSEDLLRYYITTSKIQLNEVEKIPKEYLQNLSILDPSCGSGPFLVKFFEKLCELCPECSTNNVYKDIPKSILTNFFGIDIDKHAVYFTRINLCVVSIKFFMKNKIQFSFEEFSAALFPILEENIVLGDSLLYVPVNGNLWKNEDIDLDEKIENIVHCEDAGHFLPKFLSRNFPKLVDTNFLGFSIIIGNPPYISSKDLPIEYKELLRALYTTAVHQFDIYSIFIELSIGILAPEGLFAFIMPESYLGRSSFTESRWMLLNCTRILKIENIQNAFREKSVSNIILFFKNGEIPENSFDFVRYEDKEDFTFQTGSAISIPQQYCYKIKNFKILCHPPEIREIIQKLHIDTIPLLSYIKIHRGEEIGKKSHLIIEKPGSDIHRIVSGENVKRFVVESKGTFIHSKDIMKLNAFYFQPKVMVRQLGNRIQAAFDEKGEFVTLQTVYNIISSSKSISHEFLLGLLNSDLIQFYYAVIFREKQIFPRILLENILHIPLVVPDQKEHSQIQDLVKKIMDTLKSNKNAELLISDLHNKIYDLYKIEEKEKKVIQNYLNS